MTLDPNQLIEAALPETRAVRLRTGDRCAPADIEQQVARAADAGFNVVVVRAFFRGYPYFPCSTSLSAGLPRRSPVSSASDCIVEAAAAARCYGMSLYASISCLDSGPAHGLRRSPFLHRRADWLLRSRPRFLFDAKRWKESEEAFEGRSSVWLCPAIPAVRQFFSALAAEIAAAYPVDGILLDGIRYPSTISGGDFCGCRVCAQRVEAELGIRLKDNWPEPGSEAHGRWTHWRADRLTEFVESVKARARKGRRSVRIAGAVGDALPAVSADPSRDLRMGP